MAVAGTADNGYNRFKEMSKEKVRDWLDKDDAESFFTHLGCPECGKHYEAIRKHQARNHDR